MCEFISFFHKVSETETAELAFFDLTSHAKTEEELKLNKNLWREAHYTPNGKFELRFAPGDNVPELYNERFKERFPTFISFFDYAIPKVCKDGKYSGSLYLNGLTSAEGLKLPESIGGGLYLSGLTSAEGLKLPESIGGGLDLDGLTGAEGLKLPESIGGSLYLNGLTGAEREVIRKKGYKVY